MKPTREQIDFQFELLINFHEQFAQNQNHHQSLVVKFIAGLAVVFVTFIYATVFQKSYLIQNVIGNENKIFDSLLSKGQFVISDDLYFWFSFFICH